MEQEYLRSLKKHEYQAYLIAKKHLGSSFNLNLSIGYKTFQKKSIKRK